jgi:hypothetical protein
MIQNGIEQINEKNKEQQYDLASAFISKNG